MSSLENVLYCEEEEDLSCLDFDESSEKCNQFLTEKDLFWEDDELVFLLSKEKQAHLCYTDFTTDASLMAARKEAVDWILKVCAFYRFSSITVVLAVNYFDRFASSICFQRGKIWMSQLVAVACLSVAAKVEEIRVPLLVDLQVEESRFLFEASTIQRMELLVLTTLKWKMNPVTSLSFLDHIIRRLQFKNCPHLEFQTKCERLIISFVIDPRFVCFLPSVVATAVMFFVINEVEPNNAMDYQKQIANILKINKEEIDDCYKLIVELHKQALIKKRKYECVPASPNGVMDANFSRDNSNDSWANASVSSSPERLFKRSRAPDQHMKLAPINRVSLFFAALAEF